MRPFPSTRRDVLLKLGAAMTALATASLAPPRAFAQGTIRKRKNIESLASTGQSLMPEGLEKDVSAEAMADLLAFLRSPPARRP